MIRNVRSKGGIVSFIIVGLLLLGLAAGAIYAVKSGKLNLGGKPATEVAKQATSDNKSDNTSSQDTNNTDQNQNALSEALKKQAEAEQKAKEQNQAAQSDTPAAASESTASALATVPTTGTAPESALPTTGPADDALASALVLGTITALGFAYTRSRAAL